MTTDIAREGERWLLLVMWLVASPAGRIDAQTIRGRVVDDGTKLPLQGSYVWLLDAHGASRITVETSGDGAFMLEAPAAGVYRVRVAAPGFRLFHSDTLNLAAGSRREILVAMSSLPATQLDTILVRGEAVPRYLADFYHRRRSGFGSFLTEQDIERHWPGRTTDLTSRLDGFTLAVDGAGNRIIRNLRWSGCSPMVFVDGVRVGRADTYDVDGIPPDWIAGVEAYQGAAQVPVEFNVSGAACGVLVFWTRR